MYEHLFIKRVEAVGFKTSTYYLLLFVVGSFGTWFRNPDVT